MAFWHLPMLTHTLLASTTCHLTKATNGGRPLGMPKLKFAKFRGAILQEKLATFLYKRGSQKSVQTNAKSHPYPVNFSAQKPSPRAAKTVSNSSQKPSANFVWNQVLKPSGLGVCKLGKIAQFSPLFPAKTVG